jgi:hypothetical protein
MAKGALPLHHLVNETALPPKNPKTKSDQADLKKDVDQAGHAKSTKQIQTQSTKQIQTRAQ